MVYVVHVQSSRQCLHQFLLNGQHPGFLSYELKKRAPIQNLQYDTWSRRIKNTLTIRFSPLTMYFLLSILTKLLQQATDRKITRWDNSPNTQNKVCNDNKNINFL